jgi:hypothetical protein
MSGEDERSRQGTPDGGMRPVPKEAPRPAAGSNPFLAEAPAAAAPAPAVRRRGKPPPGIISAGGVDMARAHASNIRPAADTEARPMETAKVVVAVETNPRRVQTMRNLEAARTEAGGAAGTNGASPWAQGAAEAVDKAALPSSTLPRGEAEGDRITVIPPARKREKAAAFWLRVATVVVALLLIAGVTRRMGLWTQRTPAPPPTPHVGGPLIPPPLPDDSAAGEPAPSASSGAHAGTAHPDEPIELDLEPTAEPTAKVIRVRPSRPPPPPTATFTPLFQLPGEKNN